MENQAQSLSKIVGKERRVITITSGKGGVGKSNFVANVALALRAEGKTVCIFDADLSLGNVDVLYGIRPRFNLVHFLRNERSFDDIVVQGPEGVTIIPAASGVQEMSELNENDRNRLSFHLAQLEDQYDFLLIDTGSGMSANVMSFIYAGDETIIITTPDPTAMTDAYAMIKVVSQNSPDTSLKLVINMVNHKKDALDVAEKLNLVSTKFLKCGVTYFGYVLYDERLKQSVREQVPVLLRYPQSMSSGCFRQIAKDIIKRKPQAEQTENFFSKALAFLGVKK